MGYRHRVGELVAVYAKNFVRINEFFCGVYWEKCCLVFFAEVLCFVSCSFTVGYLLIVPFCGLPDTVY